MKNKDRGKKSETLNSLGQSTVKSFLQNSFPKLLGFGPIGVELHEGFDLIIQQELAKFIFEI